jgi:hypothetical protein
MYIHFQYGKKSYEFKAVIAKFYTSLQSMILVCNRIYGPQTSKDTSLFQKYAQMLVEAYFNHLSEKDRLELLKILKTITHLPDGMNGYVFNENHGLLNVISKERSGRLEEGFIPIELCVIDSCPQNPF